MSVVMIQRGAAAGQTLPGDGQYLKAFDFEAHAGRGLITHTANLQEAMRFDSIAEAWEFWRRSPECMPLRKDGEPNRPMTAANWEFENVD